MTTPLHTWVLAAAALAAPRGGDPPAPATSQIDLDGPASVLFGDVDGDGRQDAVLLQERRLAIHRQGPDARFAPKPDFVVKLPADCVAVDLVPLDAPAPGARPRAALVAATARGGSRRALDRADAPFEELPFPPLADPLFARAAGAAPIPMTLAADLDGDGALESWVPCAGGVALLRRARGEGGDRWEWAGLAEAPVSATVETGEDRPGAVLRQTFELPRVAVVPVRPPGERPRNLLAISRGEDCWVYRLGRGGLSLLQHARAEFRFDAEDRFRAVRGTRRNEDLNDRAAGLFATDLDGDGLPDFVASRFRDGLVFVAKGREGEFAIAEPDRSIDVDGWVVLAQTRDLDGDGLPDLTVPRVPKLGLAGALRVLLSRKIDLDLWVFRNTGGPGVFGTTPDWKHTFDVEILVGGEEGRFSATARLLAGFGEFGGDGRGDFVTLLGEDRLAFRRGVKEGLFESAPFATLAIPPVGEWPEVDLRVRDLDGDGRDDVYVIYGPNKKGARNRLFFAVGPFGQGGK